MTSRLRRLAASAVLSALAVGGAFGTRPALADTTVTTCARVNDYVVCQGYVVHDPVHIVIRDVSVLSGNEITVLGVDITGLLASNDVVDEHDLQVQYSKIANGVVPILHTLGVEVCSVEVANLSTASC